MKNKKLIWGVVIGVVIIVVVVGGGYVYMVKHPIVTTPPAYNYQDWKTYKDNKYGVEINYPAKVNWGVGYVDNEEWFTSDNSKDISYSNSLSVGFGTPSSRSGGLIWNLGVMNKADFDLERYIKATGEQFSDRQEKRDKIYVGSTSALLVTVTSESNKDWVNKSVIVEKGDKVYLMGNGSINQLKDFQQFYKSLKLTSPISSPKTTLTTLKIAASGQTYTLTYPASLVYFKYSCNVDGIAFWPKATAPSIPNGNACPVSLVDSAPIVIITEGKPELMVKDKNYQDTAKMFTITEATVISQPSIKVASPKGGEVWKMGEKKEISWQSSNFLETSVGNGMNAPADVITIFINSKPIDSPPLYKFIDEASRTTTSYNWTVGSVRNDSLAAGTYYIKVCRQSVVCDWSDVPITITN